MILAFYQTMLRVAYRSSGKNLPFLFPLVRPYSSKSSKIDPFSTRIKDTTLQRKRTPEELKRMTEPRTVSQAVDRDVGLRVFLRRVYGTTGIGIGGALGSGWLFSTLAPGAILANAPMLLGVGFVTSLVGVFGLSSGTYEVNRDKTESTNSSGRLVSFGMIVGGMSLTSAPLYPIMNSISPTIMPTAAVLSISTMGLATWWAHRLPPGKLISWQQPLMAGLLGAVSVGLVSLGSTLIFGPNAFAATLHTLDVYGGIGLFSALTAYESHRAVQMYQDGDPDHLGCATSSFLDFMNLFIRFAEILARHHGYDGKDSKRKD